MSVPVSPEPSPGGRWETIRYALDSNPRTLRLCLIWFVVIVSPVVTTVITLLMRHVLLQRLRIERAFGGVTRGLSNNGTASGDSGLKYRWATATGRSDVGGAEGWIL